MQSKHGGSEASGLVLPAGFDSLKAPDGSLLVEPEQVVRARKEAEERRQRAMQLERRRIALELLAPHASLPAEPQELVERALLMTDELIKQTGGGI